MEREQIQRRLEVTTRQIGLLEGCIADAKKSEEEFDPRIYKAMVAGYTSQRNDLQAEADKYRKELGLDMHNHITKNNENNDVSKKQKFGSCALRAPLSFYLLRAPSIVLPFAIGVSDSLGYPTVPLNVRYALYTGGVVLHLNKPRSHPGYSLLREKLATGIICTIGSYWLGRGIGILGTLVDKLT